MRLTPTSQSEQHHKAGETKMIECQGAGAEVGDDLSAWRASFRAGTASPLAAAPLRADAPVGVEVSRENVNGLIRADARRPALATMRDPHHGKLGSPSDRVRNGCEAITSAAFRGGKIMHKQFEDKTSQSEKTIRQEAREHFELVELTEVELDLVTGGDGPIIPVVAQVINDTLIAYQWRG
jgi:hypothetical protein